MYTRAHMCMLAIPAGELPLVDRVKQEQHLNDELRFGKIIFHLPQAKSIKRVRFDQFVHRFQILCLCKRLRVKCSVLKLVSGERA